jgi:glucose/mannose-6-phosphate isomerase
MLEPLYNFKSQFSFTPILENNKHKENKHFVVCGMGGSAISARILKDMFSDISIDIHSDYGVPEKFVKKQTLVIISSFSGNTEETLDAYDSAIKAGFRVGVVTSGGKLLELAKSDRTAFVLIPSDGLEPRFTVGYQMLALLELMSLPVYRDKLLQAGSSIDTELCNRTGLHMAEYCADKYPSIYTGQLMSGTFYAIVAAIHEGAKRPSVLRVLPESNHNELESYSSLSLDERSRYMSVFSSNAQDNLRIKRRIEILNQLYVEQSLSPYLVYTDSGSLKSILETLLTGYFFATYLAIQKGIDPYKTELISNFKSRLA